MHDLSLTPRQRTVILASTMVGLFASSFSQTVVGTALPRIIGDLGGMNLYSWVLTSSMVTATTVVPIVGKASDNYGRKPFFMGGIFLFMVASAAAGASQDIKQLIAFRAFQGVGSGMIMASSFAVLGDLFAPAERGRYMGLFTSVFGFASIIGPTLGGYITDHLTWRATFYVNIPFSLVALMVLAVGFPRFRRSQAPSPIDCFGVAALIACVVPLLVALVLAGDRYAWSSLQVIGLLAFSSAALATFVLAESRAADPIMPLSMFQNRVFVVASLVTFLTGMGMFGTLSYMPMFVQGVMGKSATNSGVVNTPMMLGLVVASVLAGQLVFRTGRYKLLVVAGGAVLVVGMWLMTLMGPGTAWPTAARNMVLVGAGVGMTMPILNLAVQNALPYRLLGVATSSTQFFRQIGGTLGIAVFGTMVTSHLSARLRDALPPDVRAAPAPMVAALENPRVLLSPSNLDRLREAFIEVMGARGPGLFDEAISASRGVLSEALTDVFTIGLAIAVAALAVSLLLRELPLRRTIAETAAAVQATDDQPVATAQPSLGVDS